MTHLLNQENANGTSTDEPLRRPKAYSYVRFSTKRQANGDSLQRQLDRSRAYAAEHDLDLQELDTRNLWVSAFDCSNIVKGALSAFLKLVESGEIERGSYLLVENLDRLSRAQLFDAIGLLERLVKTGIRVVSLIDNRILDEETVKDPISIMWAVMVFIRANEESQTKSDRVKRAHKRKRDNLSSFAFGQGPGWLRPNSARDGWEAIPEKVASVVKVFEYAALGIGSTAIARIANREGWPVPGRATDWHKTLPHKLLHNRRVLGELEPHVKDGKVRRPTGACWANYYPAIVPVELFDAAQASAARRRNLPNRRDGGYHNVFQGLLHCGHCGATLARKPKSGNRNSPGYALYVCADRDRGLTTCPNWNARELETSLIPPLMNCVAAEILESSVKKEALQALEAERAALANEKKGLQNLLSIVERTGASDALANRIRDLEGAVAGRRARIVDLSAVANDPVSAVWAEDLDTATADALLAVRDISDERMAERALLHQSFTRVISKLWVWPNSHASLQLQSHDGAIFMPLSVEVPVAIKEAFSVSVHSREDSHLSTLVSEVGLTLVA